MQVGRDGGFTVTAETAMARYTLAQLFDGRRNVLTVNDIADVGDAMQVMLANRVSQLPVVSETGVLRGVISQQSILSLYFHAGGGVELLSLPVRHFQEPAATVDVEGDLLVAVDRLRARGVSAVIAMESSKPVGILTGKDMTRFFQALFEGLLMVEQIEVSLRECVDHVYADVDARRSALMVAFGPSKQNQHRPARGEDYLTFTDLLVLIGNPDNWPAFEPSLGPITLFDPLLERVRVVRNQLSHFRGRPDALGMDALRRTVLWLNNQFAVTSISNVGKAALPDVQLHPLSEVLAGRKAPVYVLTTATVGQALRFMTENRFGQLPVVDATAALVGMVSQQGILGLYFQTGGKAPLLDLPVHHVMEPALTLDADDTLYNAVDRLIAPGAYAAVVVKGTRPVAILTGKDMTHFFRSLFEGIILVEEIELLLRDHAARAFPDKASLNAAAIATFGPSPENPQWARRNPNKLSFGDQVWMMVDDDNWPRFEAVLGPRPVFSTLMERVRQVRNQLMHFKGQLDPLEHDVLVRTYTWLQNRPVWPDAAVVTPSPVSVVLASTSLASASPEGATDDAPKDVAGGPKPTVIIS